MPGNKKNTMSGVALCVDGLRAGGDLFAEYDRHDAQSYSETVVSTPCSGDESAEDAQKIPRILPILFADGLKLFHLRVEMNPYLEGIHSHLDRVHYLLVCIDEVIRIAIGGSENVHHLSCDVVRGRELADTLPDVNLPLGLPFGLHSQIGGEAQRLKLPQFEELFVAAGNFFPRHRFYGGHVDLLSSIELKDTSIRTITLYANNVNNGRIYE